MVALPWSWFNDLGEIQKEWSIAAMTMSVVLLLTTFEAGPVALSALIGCILVGLLLAVIGSFWMWVATYRANIMLWIVGFFVGPILGLHEIYLLVCALLHWDELKRPFHLHLIGWCLFFGAGWTLTNSSVGHNFMQITGPFQATR